jgi:Domain of unknown function (DUF1508)
MNPTEVLALGQRLADRPDRSLPQLLRVLAGTCHDFILQLMKSPDIPGRFTGAGSLVASVVLEAGAGCALAPESSDPPSNGQVVAQGENYPTKAHVKRGIASVQRAAANARIEVLGRYSLACRPRRATMV